MSVPYTLHLPSGSAPGDPRALERADLVRDGFSWGAFLVPPLWLVWHRHWLMGIAAALVVAGLAFGLKAAGAGTGTILAAEILLHLLLGLEGSSLRRFAYGRRSRPAQDVVLAGSQAEAEAKSFARWLGPSEPRPAAPRIVPPTAPVPGEQPVLGLFPDREGRR